MGKPGRSGRRCYPYPVAVGDVIPLRVLTRDAYDRMRSAFYRRADQLGHTLSVSWHERRTATIRRVA